MALEQECRRAERLQHRPDRSAFDLAVVEVGEHDALALHDHRAVVGAVLIRGQPGAAVECDDLAVWQLGHVLEPDRIELMPHHIDAESGNEHSRALRNAAERGIVEVIEMMVRQVHVIGLEKFLSNRRVRRKMPPRPPVTGPRQPRIDKDPFAARVDEQTGVPDDGEFHRPGLWIV